MSRHRLRASLALMTLVALAGAACDIQGHPERNSEDSYRTNAMEMPLNRVIIDNVSAFGGDQTDWKFFTVPTEGIVKVIFNFDNEAAEPEVFLIDSVGRIVSALDKPEASGPVLRQLSFEAIPANYYLQIVANNGETDYSVEVVHLIQPE
ncbi:MAG: hypothetical protein CMH57_03735 [Myxococcales bacterium]|nr:hypothetical protein [Myxococcales bacterium]